MLNPEVTQETIGETNCRRVDAAHPPADRLHERAEAHAAAGRRAGSPYSRSCVRLSASVYAVGGRIVRVQPRVQIVAAIVACVTSGLSTPGVRTGSARTAGAACPLLEPQHEREQRKRDACAEKQPVCRHALRRYGRRGRRAQDALADASRASTHRRGPRSQYAIHGSPITSVCTASASTAANAAARPAAHRSSRPARTSAGEQREAEREPEDGAEHAELDPELRVVRLPGLQRRARCATPSGRRCRGRSPAGGRSSCARRPSGSPSASAATARCCSSPLNGAVGPPFAICVLIREVDLRPVPRRPDLREEVRPAERDRDDRDGGDELDGTAARDREHDEPDGKRDERRARERPQQARCRRRPRARARARDGASPRRRRAARRRRGSRSRAARGTSRRAGAGTACRRRRCR